MGLFSNLFGMKNPDNQPLAAGQSFQPAPKPEAGHRQLSPAQREALAHATLPLLPTQLYLHYWLPNLPEQDPQDQTWRNQVLYFWKADEPFANKSLPPVFETFQEKTFVFAGDTSELSVQVGQAAPWFEQPGGGRSTCACATARKCPFRSCAGWGWSST
jgi:hypothetical protein